MIRSCLTLAVFASVFCFVHLSAAENSPVIPDDVTYTIISDEHSRDTKRMVDVRLNRRVPEGVLRSIAESIHSSDSTDYDLTFMTYYLPDMKVGAGAWATTHFNPELEIKVLGLTVEQYEAMQEPAEPELQREVIGIWFYEAAYAARKLVLYGEGDELTMESTFKDGSSMTEDLVEKKTSTRGRRFDHKEKSDFGEFYVIAHNGNLEMWDSEGMIDSAKKQESE